jgi:hypothetical protein
VYTLLSAHFCQRGIVSRPQRAGRFHRKERIGR